MINNYITAASLLCILALSDCFTVKAQVHDLHNRSTFSELIDNELVARGFSLWDVDFINIAEGTYSLSGSSTTISSLSLPTIALYSPIDDLNSPKLLNPNYYRPVVANMKGASLTYHGILDRRYCIPDIPFNQHFLGSGDNNALISTTLMNEITGPGGMPTMLTVAYAVLDKTLQPVVGYAHNFQNSTSGFNRFCAHNLVVDHVGFDDNPSGPRTSHSFLLPGNGMTSGILAAAVMGQTLHCPAQPCTPYVDPMALSVPRMKSYRIVDNAIPRATEFFDACINQRRIDAPQGLPSPRPRDNHILCDDWRAMVVGAKLLGTTINNVRIPGSNSYGLVAELDYQLNPLYCKICIVNYDVDNNPNTPNELLTIFHNVITAYDDDGIVSGRFVVGWCNTKYEPIKSFLIYCFIPGCPSTNPIVALPVSYVKLIDFVPLGTNEVIESIRGLEQTDDGSFVFSYNTTLAHIYVTTVDYSGNVIANVKMPTDDYPINNDLTIYKPSVFPDIEMLMCGYIQDGGESFVWKRQPTTSEVDQGCRPTEIQYTTLDPQVTWEPRTLVAYDENVMEIEITEPTIEYTEQLACDRYLCESENEGSMLLMGSHYDRGWGVTSFDENIYACGSMAGPWRQDCFIEAHCEGLENDDHSFKSLRNFDGFVSKFNEDLTTRDLYRVVVNPDDVVIQCNPELISDRGSPSYELLYGMSASEMSADDNIVTIHIAGTLVTVQGTKEDPSTVTDCDGVDHCAQPYPKSNYHVPYGAFGEYNALMIAIKNLGESGELVRALKFGRDGYLVHPSNYDFRALEKNIDQFSIDEPQPVGSTVVYDEGKANSHDTEVLHDVSTVKDEEYDMSVFVGFTAAKKYEDNVPYDCFSFTLHDYFNKCGLLVGLSDFIDAEDCSDVDHKWVKLLASTNEEDKSISFSAIDVFKSNDENTCVTVGYTQHHASVLNTGDDQRWNNWDGGPPHGTGVVLRLDKDGNIFKGARIFYSREKSSCSDQFNNDLWDGTIRLFDTKCIDADDDGNTDGIVVTGGILLPKKVAGMDNAECMFVAMLDPDLNIVWQRIYRTEGYVKPISATQPVTPSYESYYYSTLRTVDVNSNNNLVLVGETGYTTESPEEYPARPVVLELSLTGELLRHKYLNTDDDCQVDIVEDLGTHPEQVVCANNKTYVVGTTYDYKEPVSDVSGNAITTCSRNGSFGENSGDVFVIQADCWDNYFGATNLGVEQVTLVNRVYNVATFVPETPSIVSMTCDSDITDIMLGFHDFNEEEMCIFISVYDNTEVIPTPFNTNCPESATNRYNRKIGTHHGYRVINGNCED